MQNNRFSSYYTIFLFWKSYNYTILYPSWLNFLILNKTIYEQKCIKKIKDRRIILKSYWLVWYSERRLTLFSQILKLSFMPFMWNFCSFFVLEIQNTITKTIRLQQRINIFTLQISSPWNPPAINNLSRTARVLTCVWVNPSKRLPGCFCQTRNFKRKSILTCII